MVATSLRNGPLRPSGERSCHHPRLGARERRDGEPDCSDSWAVLTDKRELVSTLLDRLAEPAGPLIYVTGPRQSGKTTLVRQALRKVGRPCRYLPADEQELRPASDDFAFMAAGDRKPNGTPIGAAKTAEWLVRTWEDARVEAGRSGSGFILALDEIQTIPDWSRTVKWLWDADRARNLPLHAVLLGSAPLLMQKNLSEALTGRFDPLPVPHWSFAEMSAAFGFDLPTYLYFGGYPGAERYKSDSTRWRRHVNQVIIEPNIDRDILALQRVEKPTLLKQLFELGTYHSGQILSYNKMLGQFEEKSHTTTLTRYFALLAKVGLIESLPFYSTGFSGQKKYASKLNVLNTALISACSAYSFEAAQEDWRFWGRLAESAVGAHLLNTKEERMRLSYWWHSGDVVDFVLNFDQRLFAIGVESDKTRNLRGWEAFRSNYRKSKPTLVLVGHDGIPLEEFLATPAETLFESL